MLKTFQTDQNYGLFDKFWYLRRAERFLSSEYTGLCIKGDDIVINKLPDRLMTLKGQSTPQIKQPKRRELVSHLTKETSDVIDSSVDDSEVRD